jgi:ATP-dependent DNA helicase RecG
VQLHQPADLDHAELSRERLTFDEAFLLQSLLVMRRIELKKLNSTSRKRISGGLLDAFDATLPFQLTAGQVAVCKEIESDLAQPHPMHRLLQGEVGSGKTIVALRAMLAVIDSGGQAALLAPTEVLAAQHLRTFQKLLGELGQGGMLGGSDKATQITLITGSQSAAARKEALSMASSGNAGIVIGTHALLGEKVEFKDLGLIVVDEQHRFGVEQRAAMRAKVARATGEVPHILVMTATPIPRTLSLTVFGDLDVSVIRTRPAGRQPVTTRVVGRDKESEVYAYLRTRIDGGEQCYVVVPAVEESATGLKDAEGTARALAAGVFAGLRVGVVHGQLARDSREATMDAFRRGELDVLVATVVIEVGVDVANASLMVIEHADRFGLAQLHQLRGRVGRGERKSLCVFIGEPITDDARKRLDAIGTTDDGFEIAELDLAIRGPGELFGSRQSGLPPFKVADLMHDMELLRLARRDAKDWIERDGDLGAPEHRLLRRKLMHSYGGALGLADVA